MRIIFCICLLASILLSTQCDIKNKAGKNTATNDVSVDYPHYDITLKLDPHTSFIQVDGKLTVPMMQIKANAMIFLLDSGMQVDKFTFNNVDVYANDSVSPKLNYMPAASQICSIDKLKMKDETSEFAFSYKGTLSELPPYFANTVSSNWVEMGLYYPWFPYSESIKHFTYKLNIHIDSSYTTFGLGKSYAQNATQIMECTFPTNDMVLCASKDVITESWKKGKNRLNLYYHTLHDSMVGKLQSDLSAIVSQLSNYFGEEDRTLNVILSKRERGGGYGRIGGMFLGGFKTEKYYTSNEGYHRYFAHEISHMWWHKADANTWEDWLNEGFAEYTALMVVRDLFGDASFAKRIQAKQEAIANTPPIWGFARSDNSTKEAMRNAELLLYSKGPVLLYELENKIGRKPFLSFCNQLISNKMDNTKDFLSLLSSTVGEETSKWMEGLLKTF